MQTICKEYKDEMGYKSNTTLDETGRIIYFKNNRNLEYTIDYDNDGTFHRSYINNHSGIDAKTMNWGFKSE